MAQNSGAWARAKRRAKAYYKDNRSWMTMLIKVLCMVLAALVFAFSLRTITLSGNLGVDVSSHNGRIKWSAVRRDGVSFALIRCGGRAYGQSARIYGDTEFRYNLRHAHQNGLRVGVYFYSQAVSEDEARAEAQYCVDQLKGASLELPVYIDFEDTYTGGKGRADSLTNLQRTNAINAFCEVIRDSGYKAGVYSNRWFLEHRINVNDLDRGTSVWVAEYHNRKNPLYSGDWDIWQYSSTGQVDGIEGSTDLNRLVSSKPS